MNQLKLCGAILMAGALQAGSLPSAAAPPERDMWHTGPILYERAFDPELNFAGDLLVHSRSALIMTARAGQQEELAPSYSLAIAYFCRLGRRECSVTARVLRVHDDYFDLRESMRVMHRVAEADDDENIGRTLDGSTLQWLEANVETCPGAADAVDAVRTSDWRPDPSGFLPAPDGGPVLMHAARVHVRYSGMEATARFHGWTEAAGVPAALSRLLDVLQPCWGPSASPPPWRRTKTQRHAR